MEPAAKRVVLKGVKATGLRIPCKDRTKRSFVCTVTKRKSKNYGEAWLSRMSKEPFRLRDGLIVD